MPLRVLILVRHYLPGHRSGGPIRAIANLVGWLGKEFEFRILTSDRDALDMQPYPDVLVNRWHRIGDADVYYAGPEQVSFAGVTGLIRSTPHDLLYLNSFFDGHFTIPALLARRLGQIPQHPVILAPRGEFAPSALALKWWKKRPFVLGSRAIGLHRGVVWQASSEYEAEDVRRVVGRGQPVTIAPDLAPVPVRSSATAARHKRDQDPLRVLFLSRITPMKNLDYALRVLQRVSTPVDFDIYGPIRDAPYWKVCGDLLSTLPGNVRARYLGEVPHDQVSSIMGRYDLFFLPTRGENFGHVVLEALLAGTPVLIADTTPWRGLADLGVGWDLALGQPEAFARQIEECCLIPSYAYTGLRALVRAKAEAFQASPEGVDAVRRILTELHSSTA